MAVSGRDAGGLRVEELFHDRPRAAAAIKFHGPAGQARLSGGIKDAVAVGVVKHLTVDRGRQHGPLLQLLRAGDGSARPCDEVLQSDVGGLLSTSWFESGR